MKTYFEELGPNLQASGLDFLFIHSLGNRQSRRNLYSSKYVFSLTELIFTTLVPAGHHNFAMSEFTVLDENTFI